MIHSLLEFVEYSDGVVLEYQAKDKKALIQFGDEERMYKYENNEWMLDLEE